ncbi:unnamed protein product [Caenorhabditis sp. 36 PRJEB53466]|nr:unnamed protein product [Caenorhabditis sp. 36 PRJEB53466]
MSVDVKSEFSENDSSSTPSPTTLPLQNSHDICKQSDQNEWTNYQMVPLWNAHPFRDKMLQSSFDPQLYGRWPQMGDASSFYNHPDFYSSLSLQQMTPSQVAPAVSDSEVKPPLSNGSSSDSGASMYPSPTDMIPFSSTSASTSAAAANYQMRATTCYQQAVWPFVDYQQPFAWKMPLGGSKDRRSLVGNSSKALPTGPGTNNVRVRTADKYRMVYSDYQRLELEKEFHTQAFITADRKSQLSTLLNLTERQIKIWFQNRRAKDRRDKQKVRL